MALKGAVYVRVFELFKLGGTHSGYKQTKLFFSSALVLLKIFQFFVTNVGQMSFDRFW